MPRNPNDCVDVLGPDGNLPQYKVGDNNCNIDMAGITMPGITINNFREYHTRCPFDINPKGLDDAHLVRNMNRFSVNYWRFEVTIPPGQRAQHTTTSGVMAKWSRGSKYGWVCADDVCPYHGGITVTDEGEEAVISIPGERYFYY